MKFILTILVVAIGHFNVMGQCSILGRVVERRSNEPIANVVVALDGAVVTQTDAKGAFVIEHMERGDHTISAIIPTWGEFATHYTCASGTTDEIRIVAWPSFRVPLQGVLAHFALDGDCRDDGPDAWESVNKGGVACESRTGRVGAALAFSTRMARVEVVAPDRMNTPPFTVSFWARVDRGCEPSCLVLGRRPYPYNDSWSVSTVGGQWDSSGRWDCEWYDVTANRHASSIQHADLGTWHHVVYCVDTAKTILYIDNEPFPECSATARYVPRSPPSRPIFIGGTDYLLSWENGFRGAIDDVYFFDHVLRDDERALLGADR